MKKCPLQLKSIETEADIIKADRTAYIIEHNFDRLNPLAYDYV